MSFRKFGSFRGGINLPEPDTSALESPVAPCPPIHQLRVPLGSKPHQLQVQPGQRVHPGQILANRSDGGGDIVAPLAGKVAGTVAVSIAHQSRLIASEAIELVELSDPVEPFAAAEDLRDYKSLTIEAKLDRIRRVGVNIHRQPGGKLIGWIERARRKGCAILVANAMGAEPVIVSDHCCLAQRGREVIEGLSHLAELIGAKEIVLAADLRRTEQYRKVIASAQAGKIDLVALSEKYPTGADPILIEILTREEIPPGGTTMDVGVAVVNPSTCLAVRTALATDKQPTHRVVTITGERAIRRGNFWVPIGAAMSDLAGGGGTIIAGGVMTGTRCDEQTVVTHTTDAILSIDAAAPAPATPCIRCCWCTDHCPSRLNVASLNDAFELGDIDQAQKLTAPACVGCGICSYICPARLPLAQRMRELKRVIASKRNSAELSGKK